MNYGQFLNMVPEYYLVLILLAVFVVDFIMHRSEKKVDVLFSVTAALLVVLPVRIALLSEPAEAFGGLYVASQAVNVMKVILAVGTLIVVIMAQPWIEKTKRLAGEFYMLILSTLLGMFVMMSSGNFLMFFLGLEMASVPLACLVAFDKDRKNSAEGAAKYILVATFSSGNLCRYWYALFRRCGNSDQDFSIGYYGSRVLLQWSGLQDFVGAFPLLDSRHLSGSANACHRLSECDF